MPIGEYWLAVPPKTCLNSLQTSLSAKLDNGQLEMALNIFIFLCGGGGQLSYETSHVPLSTNNCGAQLSPQPHWTMMNY